MVARFVELLARIAGRIHNGMVSALFLIFERTLPVRDDYWCFATWERYSHTLDNPRAVFEEVKADPSIRKIVLQKRSAPPDELVEEGTNVTFVDAASLRGAYYLSRARVVLTGYALGGMSSYSQWIRASRHAVIQLWHGIPIKRIGHLFPDEAFWKDETPRYAATVCSSPEDREIMSRAFAPIPWERVWMTGLPRNDLILKPRSDLPADYRQHLAELEGQTRGKTLVLYAPTWRSRPESIYRFSPAEKGALEAVLKRHDAVMAVRGHSNVRNQAAFRDLHESPLIFSVDRYPDANLILRRADILVTDYSSIFIDFLLLDRPILHFAYDLDEYVEERGFLYDLEDAFAGPVATTFEELVSLLEQTLQDGSRHSEDRLRAARLFHDHGPRAAADVRTRILELSQSSTADRERE